MSIVLKDGTVLPDIPSEVKDQYSDIVIVYARTMIGYPSETENYMLVAANADFVHYNEATGEEAGDYIRFPSECVSYACAVDDLSEWSLGATSPNPVMCPLGNTVVQEYNLLWSNHDIRTATTVDVDTLEYTLGTAIYFKSSIFRLPDGTELPALPAGCFEENPYGFVSKVLNGDKVHYQFYVLTGESVYAPAEVTGFDYGIVMFPLGAKLYEYLSGQTEWAQAELDPSTGGTLEGTISEFEITQTMVWVNHDVLTATAVDDNGNVTSVGSTLYRKSDVNYRIYGGWLNSMGNQARRLGGVSGELKPGEMESVFSGATLEPLTVTPTTEEQTFTPESPCIGFSVVTVEAAPDTGGGEPEIIIKEYPDAETTVFGNEYVQKAVPTGRYWYGSYYQGIGTNGADGAMPPIPENSAYPYAIVSYLGSNGYHYVTLTDKPGYYVASGGSYYVKYDKPNGIQYRMQQTGSGLVNQSAEWVQCATYTGTQNVLVKSEGNGTYYNSSIVAWANYNVMYDSVDGTSVYRAATQPVPQTTVSTVAEPIEHPGDGMYQISGDTLNELVGLAQQLTGTTATTPGGAIDAMNAYLGNDTTT